MLKLEEIERDAQVRGIQGGEIVRIVQVELFEKRNLRFEIFGKEKKEQCATGNFFAETDRLVRRLDQLAPHEEFKAKLAAIEWDLAIVDEAHKLSARFFGPKIGETTCYEIVCGLNQADKFILANVVVDRDSFEGPFYLTRPFQSEPDFGVASVNFDLKERLSKAVPPEKSI